MPTRVTLDVRRALQELYTTPAAKWRTRCRHILNALANGEHGVDDWADEMLEADEAEAARRAEISEKRRIAARAKASKCRANAEHVQSKCKANAEQMQNDGADGGDPSPSPHPGKVRTRETESRTGAASAGSNSQKSTISSLSSCRPLPPPSSTPAAAGAGGSAAPTAAGGKGADVGTLEGSPYAGMESAIRRSPLSVGRFLQVATAGCLRREQAEEWVLANEAGNWTTTSASGIERTMTENEAARRLASFCTSVRRGAGKNGGVRRPADNYFGGDGANEEKFRRLAGG